MPNTLESKTKNINVRVKPSEFELLKKQASECEMRLSDLIRQRIII
jgi:predicted DNA binding CopG/RHH family protein